MQLENVHHFWAGDFKPSSNLQGARQQRDGPKNHKTHKFTQHPGDWYSQRLLWWKLTCSLVLLFLFSGKVKNLFCNIVMRCSTCPPSTIYPKTSGDAGIRSPKKASAKGSICYLSSLFQECEGDLLIFTLSLHFLYILTPGSSCQKEQLP